ncbi:MAG: hypothetical protein ACLP7F_14025 [Acidimicrobiales bacterium]
MGRPSARDPIGRAKWRSVACSRRTVLFGLGALLLGVTGTTSQGGAALPAVRSQAPDRPATPYPLPAPAVYPPPCTKLPISPPPRLAPPAVPEPSVPVVASPGPRRVPRSAHEGKGLLTAAFPGHPINAARLVDDARRAKLDALYVRTGSSSSGFYGAPLLKELVPLAHRYGIAVIAWDFPTLSDPAADAARAADAFHYGVDAFSPDIEEAPEGTYLTARRVAYYLSLVRKDAGPRPVIATVPRPTTLSLGPYPYAAEAPFVDAFAPMVYWSCAEPGAAVTVAIDALRPLRPVVPIGQDYNMADEGGPAGLPSGREVWRFVDVARRHGAIGVSLYDLESGGPAQLAALTDYPWPQVTYSPYSVPSPAKKVPAPRTAALQSGRWTAAVALLRDGAGASLPSISCASAHQCIAVGTKGSGEAGTGIAFNGARTWSPSAEIDDNGGLSAASCVRDGPCTATGVGFGAGGDTYRFVHGKWSSGPSSVASLNSVSCPTVDFCAGVGFLNYASAFIFDGEGWSDQIPIGAQGVSVSCPTTRFCAVVSESGDVLYYQDGKWTKATSIDPDRGLSSVSCTSAAFCVAVDASGNALTDKNGRWSKPNYAAPLDAQSSLTGVSCPTTTLCVAVDSDGAAYYYSGSRWSSSQEIANGTYLTSVSCPTVNFCAAAGQNAFISPTAVYVVEEVGVGGAERASSQ